MREVRNKHYTIAIMVGDTQSEYSEELMRGFYAGAHEEGVNIVLFMGPQMPTYCTDIMTSSITGNYRYQFNSIYQYTHFMKPDALIISYGTLSAFNSEQSRQSFFDQFADTPYLIIEDTSSDDKIPYLATDNYSGMKACMEHLILEHGYRKITFLSGPQGNHDAEERLQAYRDTMQQYGLEVEDTMITYGDYTDQVEEQINYLFDHNSKVEAIVCANDAMAKACYRVCITRNIIVGKDVAITGFDDIGPASTMTPPLTSVSQNSFQVSYTALKKAAALCRGEKIISGSMPTRLKKRCSCGCSPMKILEAKYVPEQEIEAFMEQAIREVADYIFDSVSYEKERKYLTQALSDYFYYIYNTLFQGDYENFDMDHLLDILRVMAAYPYLSNSLVLENITQLLQILMANAKDAYSQSMIAAIISSSEQFVHSLNIEKLEKEIYISNRKSWFVPTFTRDLASESYLAKPQKIFYRVMEELKKMAVRSGYFFLFDESVVHQPGKLLEFPDHMHLVAYFDEKDMKFYRKGEQPVCSATMGGLSYMDGQEPVCLTSVLLFSERKQYGILVCEVDHADIAFLQICSVQLGTLLHFVELNLLEQQAQRDLQNSLRVIKEQNTILSFISEYDELTKLLNCRGFIEQALSMYEAGEGKKAYLIFGDLDHLKEINDVYGHAEGDFALKASAERLKRILPDDCICGRIGGDEFVAFLFTDEEGFKARMESEFAQAGAEFNANCEKPYYVEMSMGVHEFICNPRVKFDEMLKISDKLLYEAKRTRRMSVKK